MKTYLDERNAENLHQTTVLAEDYSLTHKDTFPSGVKDSSAVLMEHLVLVVEQQKPT